MSPREIKTVLIEDVVRPKRAPSRKLALTHGSDFASGIDADFRPEQATSDKSVGF
jgi:hypothetical protein